MNSSSISYNRHRFSPQIISHAVWLYARFNLSLYESEEMLLQRGIDVSYETIRRWDIKFGAQIARKFRKRQVRPGDIWHLDEVVVRVSCRMFWLCCAVDQHGVVLDEILQPQRNKRVAKRLLPRLIKRPAFIPKRIVTDKLRSSGAAKRDIVPGLDH
jgi:putative transposase